MKQALLAVILAGLGSLAAAQMIRPPAFVGGVPGLAQSRALDIQRHQARTLLYREALEELRKNPAAADAPDCAETRVSSPRALCLTRTPVSAAPETEVKSVAVTEAAAPVTAKDDSTKPKPDVPEAAPTIRKRLAVLIGNNDYKTPIPELETPVADVTEIAAVLKRQFGFETRVLKNAGKAEIFSALNQIAQDATPDDSVLLFYAGHGYLMEDTKMGFWIPVDASVKTASGWISNTDISKLLGAIKAKQLILVSDSCFSGSLTHEQKVKYAGSPKRDEILRRRSVLAFSSGGDEPVSDEGKEGHSIFAWNLIKTLQSANGIASGYEVYRAVHGQVTKDAEQEPQYGAVVSAGHVTGGEYLFESAKQ